VSALDGARAQAKRLIEGGKLRCPGCGELRHLHWYRAFDRPPAYERELNVIYQCTKARGGCGHAFSPGDPQILEAYLSGELVPVAMIPDLIYRGLGHDPRSQHPHSNGVSEEVADA
jgi:hypothetical protein